MRIGIIGAGIAGGLLADQLRRAPGLAVSAFERVQSDELAEAGTGLSVGPNAMKALRLHQRGLHDVLRTVSLPWETWSIALADGTPLLHIDLRSLAEEPGIRLRWAELYRVMRAPLDGFARWGCALEALEQDAAGRLVPVFRRGGALMRDGGFDLLVAADGRYSRLRALSAGEPPMEVQGVCMWRLLVHDGSQCPFDDFGQWFNGPNRLLAYALPGGAVHVAGAFPLAADLQIPEAARTPAAQRALFTPADTRPCPAVAWMLDRMAAGFADIHWARSQTTPMLRTLLEDRILLLGDAAHGMVPTLGQGATQAIEDGVLAAATLRRGGSPSDFAAMREDRVAFVRDFSVEASDTLLPGSDPVAGTRVKGEPAFTAKLRRLWTDVPQPN